MFGYEWGSYISVPKRVEWNCINYQTLKPRLVTTNYYCYGIAGVHEAPNPNVEEFVFGPKVKTIPDYLCWGLSGIKEIIIPDSVQTIGGRYTFYGCDGITKLTIGKSLVDANYSFGYCKNLQTVYCKATTPPNNVGFSSSVKIIYVPRNSIDEYRILWSAYADIMMPYDFE